MRNQILQRVGRISAQIYAGLPYLRLVIKHVVALLRNTKSEVESVRKHQHRAAVNNFRLGIKMLNAGCLHDAMLRFWLAGKFHKHSAINDYYMAYVHYRCGNIDKAIRYLYMSYAKAPIRHQRCKYLLQKILSVYPLQFGRVIQKRKAQCAKNEEDLLVNNTYTTKNTITHGNKYLP